MICLKGSRSYNRQLLSKILGNNSVPEDPKFPSAYLRMTRGPSLPGTLSFFTTESPRSWETTQF